MNAIFRGEVYAKQAERAAQMQQRVAQIEEELIAALERWEALAAR